MDEASNKDAIENCVMAVPMIPDDIWTFSSTCLAERVPDEATLRRRIKPASPSAMPSANPATGVSRFAMPAASFIGFIHQRQHD
ncbi:MAG: hypothetical protein Q8S20_07100 [Sulfuritalea sp.]|nr:hypothetical protein [Sulfuritalea sp.]